jgi:hypothetical protein
VSELNEDDFPPLEPQPFVTAEGREIERLRAELAAAIKQRDEARRWLRDACAEIARIENRFYDALTPQQIAERNGWDCFKEGGGA